MNAANQFYGSSYQPSQQVYTPTGLLLEQQRLQEQQEEGETILPVWQRRKQFQQGPGQNSAGSKQAWHHMIMGVTCQFWVIVVTLNTADSAPATCGMLARLFCLRTSY